MWDLIVSVPDHCLSFYFLYHEYKEGQSEDEILTTGMKQLTGVMHDTFEIFLGTKDTTLINQKSETSWLRHIVWISNNHLIFNKIFDRDNIMGKGRLFLN